MTARWISRRKPASSTGSIGIGYTLPSTKLCRHDFYPDWDEAADGMVALLRKEAGHNPCDRDLTDLVGELATRSDEFRTRWAGHDVRMHLTGTNDSTTQSSASSK